MNTLNIEMIEAPEAPGTTLSLKERAAVALGSSTAHRELALMALKSAHIDKISNAAGREECHSYAMALRTARTTVSKRSKDARDDAVKFSKSVIAEESILISYIEPEENRLLALRNAWDSQIQAEKEAKAAEERARVVVIATRLADIRAYLPMAQNARFADRVETLLNMLVAARLEYDFEDDFAEFGPEAQDAYNATHAAITELLTAKRADEAAAAELKAKQEADAKALEDQRIAQAAEAAKLADERAKLEADKALLAAQLAALQPVPTHTIAFQVEATAEDDTDPAIAAYAAAIAQPAPVIASPSITLSGRFTKPALKLAILSTRPSDAEILDAVAEHFCVSDATALKWLQSIDLSALAAEFEGATA